ncbi:hypothetical protein [Verrucosispora sp. NA02020]|uniref:hypothetical protein n=1 Tax=Verrucosispora sp. NA02020 TaxID=2742132 RepID=UPI003D72C1BC
MTLDDITTPADLIAACDTADAQADAEAREVIAEQAWDAADELAPYTKPTTPEGTTR